MIPIAEVRVAIEKQKPLKVERHQGTGLYMCGECSILLSDTDNYCSKCGQRVDRG